MLFKVDYLRRSSMGASRLCLEAHVIWPGFKQFGPRGQQETRGREPSGTISQSMYELIIEISKIALCSNLCSDDPFWSQICTCQDSSAVMACAKLGPDLIIIFHVRVKYKIWVMSSSTLCELGSGHVTGSIVQDLMAAFHEDISWGNEGTVINGIMWRPVKFVSTWRCISLCLDIS